MGDLRKELSKVLFFWKDRKGIYNIFKKKCPSRSCVYSSNADANFPLTRRYIVLRKISDRKDTYGK